MAYRHVDQHPEPWLTLNQAARHAQCSTRHLTRAVQFGFLEAGRVGRHLRFRVSDLDEYITRDRSKTAPSEDLAAHIRRLAGRDGDA